MREMKLTAQRPRRPSLPGDRVRRKSTDQDTAIVGADIHSDSCLGGRGEVRFGTNMRAVRLDVGF